MQLKLGVSTTISTGEILSQDFLTMEEKLFLTQELTLNFAKAHKLKYVELSIPDAYNIKDINQPQFLDMLSTHNLRYTYHAPIFDINLGATNERWRKLSVKIINEHIMFARDMNIENVVVHPYRPMGLEVFFLGQIVGNVIKSLHEINAKNDTSVKILVENLPCMGELFCNPDTLLLLEDCLFCYDTSHANCAGFAQKEFISELGNRIHEIHVIDGKKNKMDMHLPIGKGDIDFRETYKALKDIRFCGPVILEAFSIEDAASSIRILKDIFR